jgi:hypothetical protein
VKIEFNLGEFLLNFFQNLIIYLPIKSISLTQGLKSSKNDLSNAMPNIGAFWRNLRFLGYEKNLRPIKIFR